MIEKSIYDTIGTKLYYGLLYGSATHIGPGYSLN